MSHLIYKETEDHRSLVISTILAQNLGLHPNFLIHIHNIVSFPYNSLTSTVQASQSKTMNAGG